MLIIFILEDFKAKDFYLQQLCMYSMTCYATFDSSPPDVVVHELTPEGEKDRVVPVLGLLPCAPLRLQDRHGDAPRTRQPALRWSEGAREKKSIVSSCRCRYYYRMV